MAFTYRIDKKNRIVRLKGEPPNFDAWKQTLSAVFADPDFEAGFNFLSDRRHSEHPRSSDFLRAALDFLQTHADKIGKCKWATVVSTTAQYGMGRMAQILSERTGIEVEVFTDMEKAQRWLTTEKPLLDE